MGLFRSEDLYLCKTTMTKDCAYESVKQLGRLGMVSFVDLNINEQVYDLPYAKEVSRCNETLKSIDSILQECERLKLPLKTPASINEYYMAQNGLGQVMQVAEHRMFDCVEKEVQEYDEFLSTQTKSLRSIKSDYQHLQDYRDALLAAAKLLDRQPVNKGKWAYLNRGNTLEKVSERDHEESKEYPSKKKLHEESNNSFQIKIGHLIGTVGTEDCFNFKRLIFRATRGNALIQMEDIKPKKLKPDQTLRSSFVVTFQEGTSIREKLERIIQSFGARLYDYPEQNFSKVIEDLENKMKDTKRLLKDSNRELKNYLIQLNDLESKKMLGGNSPFYGISTLPMYKMFVQIEEQIYRNMNCLRSVDNGNVQYGFVWSTEKAEVIEDELSRKGALLQELQFENIHNHEFETPTLFKTNAFTEQFHSIVETYGIPKYKEVNPSLFTIISFPFLFGVMFGDIGHGGLLFISAAFLCMFGDKVKALKPIFQARYLLLLMGFFSFFCGFMYNDFMSIPIELSHSCFTKGINGYRHNPNCVYPFGIDPKWYVATNELTFMNSFKMKLAVILGVSQMLLGIFLRFFNAHDFCDYVEFIAQFTVLCCWFGYMNVLIIAKWLTHYPDSSRAPAIIASMIDMFLKFGACEKTPIISDKAGTEHIQILLLIISFACIPLMLFLRPILALVAGDHAGHQQPGEIELEHTIGKRGKGYNKFEDEDEYDGFQEEERKFTEENMKDVIEENKDQNFEDMSNKGIKDDEPSEIHNRERHHEQMNSLRKVLKIENHGHSMEELFVHQLIETIEFVLGTVSNTASYLRLWALSLAHSQLADVFYEKTLVMGLEYKSPVMLFILQQLFWVATLGVLMSMDSMECFLHTLRLHWVEFQNKFYKGTGTKFAPLSFKQIAIGNDN
ncbi:unnamed protein product [Moneuplotes crassus]|uniref:V-type proton ATPase subunit a n=1 Tax=Euplotes crassus TaxID=5936 RepID=A0AAD1Y441_EUPCR|nr:unnamed protein product [Moneuplotes crassus]